MVGSRCRILAVLPLLLAFVACAGGGGGAAGTATTGGQPMALAFADALPITVTTARFPAGCQPGEVTRLITDFITAFNAGDQGRLAGFFPADSILPSRASPSTPSPRLGWGRMASRALLLGRQPRATPGLLPGAAWAAGAAAVAPTVGRAGRRADRGDRRDCLHPHPPRGRSPAGSAAPKGSPRARGRFTARAGRSTSGAWGRDTRSRRGCRRRRCLASSAWGDGTAPSGGSVLPARAPGTRAACPTRCSTVPPRTFRG